jgi:hypothetical protein
MARVMWASLVAQLCRQLKKKRVIPSTLRVNPRNRLLAGLEQEGVSLP